jgi:5'-nucleotidase
MSRASSRLALGGLLAANGLLPAACGASTRVTVSIIAFNDFHGNLESGNLRWAETPAGGADWMAAHIAALKARNPNSVVVSAGDLIGASPLVSALYHDEPTIEAMNGLGLEISGVGNHEFDEGRDELLRMQNGGCHPTDAGHSCQGAGAGTGVRFEGAAFEFLAANVTDDRTGRTLFHAYSLREFEGVAVAFIGMTLEATPSLVAPSAVADLEFHDEAQTANALVPEIRKHGAEAIVVLLHQGGATTGGMNECPGLFGPIVDIVAALDDEVDLVISGHTHRAYTCRLPNRAGRAVPVTSAGCFGCLLTEIELTLDRSTRDVVAVAAVNRIIEHAAVRPQASLSSLVERYRALAAPIIDRAVGTISADIVSSRDASRGSPLGELIADAQLEATRSAGHGGAVVAFMNSDGIRADLIHAASGTEGDGKVTHGEAFAVLPFGDALVTMTLTGQQIYDLLEQQWGADQPYARILQASNGFSYQHTFDAAGEFTAQKGGRYVCPGSVRIGGMPVDGRRSYRVTVNAYLAEGGANFAVLRNGVQRRVAGEDLATLEAYIARHSPVAPPAAARTRKVERCR